MVEKLKEKQDPGLETEKGVSRREFIRLGAAGTALGAAAVTAPGKVAAKAGMANAAVKEGNEFFLFVLKLVA